MSVTGFCAEYPDPEIRALHVAFVEFEEPPDVATMQAYRYLDNPPAVKRVLHAVDLRNDWFDPLVVTVGISGVSTYGVRLLNFPTDFPPPVPGGSWNYCVVQAQVIAVE